jgi:MFS family permease
MATGPGLLTSLRHRDFRLLMVAFTGSATGSWAYNVALVVWIFDETGSAAWVSASTVVQFLPALLFSAYGGVVADRYERVRLMVLVDLASTVIMIGLAVLTALHAPVLLVIVVAALAGTLSTAYQPAAAALTPQLVGERDLGSANALRNTIDNLAVIVGPALGVMVLLAGPPPVAIAINALSFLLSAAAVGRIAVRSTPVDVSEGGEAGPLMQMTVGIKAIGSSATATVLVAYSIAATFVFGTDTVLFVLLSRDVLGTGAEGYGYLLAGLGVGGLVAAPLVTRMERLPRLSVVILLGMVAYCLPTLALLFVSEPAVGFVVQVIRGAGTLFVDVLAITALQRALPRHLLGRVFGAFDGMCLLAVVIGSLTVPIVVAAAGLEATVWLVSVCVPVACLLGLPALRRVDREAAKRRAALEPRSRLLSACDLFDSVSEGAVEQLAAAAEEVAVPAGTAVITEGKRPDFFYIIVEGRLGVSALGEHDVMQTLVDMGAGEYFGEIGLIEQIPRTATVTALTDSTLLRIDGSKLLAALTESTPSAAILDGARMRLGRTHPSRGISRVGLKREETSD